MRIIVRNFLSITAIMLLVSSCGGGGGGGGGGAPPATLNSPPRVVVSAPSQVRELQEFSIDANQSFDPDGAITTVSIAQTSGPTASYLGETSPRRFLFAAPRIVGEGTETLAFSVRAVDDDGAATTLDLNVTAQGLADGPGRLVAVYDPPLRLMLSNIVAPGELPNGEDGVIATQSVNGRIRITVIGGSSANYALHDETKFDRDFLSVDLINGRTLTTNGNPPLSPAGWDFSVMSEVEDTFRWFYRQANGAASSWRYTQGDSFSIQDPCSLIGRRAIPQDRIWIGQRSGFSIVRVIDTAPQIFSFGGVLSRVENGRALCLLLPTRLDTPTPSPIPVNPQVFRPEIIALDYNSNEIVLLHEVAGDSTYEVFRTIPLDTGVSAPLRIVSAFSRGGPNEVPRYVVVLLTDGQHTGNHLLIIVSQSGTSPDLQQQVFSWTEGVPVAVLEGAFKSELFPRDLVVVRSTSSQAMYFAGTAANSGSAFTYSFPTYFDTGLGAGSAVTAWNGTSGPVNRTGVLISYPDTGALRLVSLSTP